ncbi:GntR family transcriptional regulator [Bacillus cereus]|nr:GntR family transcriptional regulator [Bacillus cereus]
MKTTLEGLAYIKIRNYILSGKYEEGERLTEARLVKDLNMSRTPIRNALSRLTSEGILNHQSHCGITVAQTGTPIKKMIEVLEICLVFVKHTIDKVQKNAVSFDLELLQKNINILDDSLKQENYSKYHLTLWDIYEVLLQTSGNNSMVEIIKNTKEKVLLNSINTTYLHELNNLFQRLIPCLKNKEYEQAKYIFERISKEHIINLL